MKSIPNYITAVRIIGALCLFFTPPLSSVFFVVYTLSGISDVLDGFMARKLGAVSEFGSRLDSASDIIFYSAMITRLFPILWARLPIFIWISVGIYAALRLAAYLVAALKFGRFASLHTLLNKASTLAVFFVPYLINGSFLTPYCAALCTLGIASSLEELVIHLKSDSYNAGEKNK
ncbi:MAG: CDP-alcohol phosphatidyltransferase family protein [Clostridia bacterium]|nr:CDP-alcohol phosphatidyltransferase family protein [Clostridia bacterium]